jgi:hypothetical protein
MPNLANAPTFKLIDRRAILSRVLEALQNDPACRWNFKGPWARLTLDEQANWDARSTIGALLSDIPRPDSA